ncbi:hypothetical protein ABZ876_33120 [Streptomyces sp. NPDC046931]|uniref:hypothetical protein n=1 Tax=Streptomyces sp. NPDC046931 TaxID=3154806 RepID=UPI0033FE83D0
MSGPMRAYLMTRGTMRKKDYAFVGETPDEPWWDALTPWVFLESEEVIVHRSEAGGASLLISGIPSRRTDVLGTRIRHTVVVEDAHHEHGLALWMVRCGLDDEERTRLGDALDGAFPGDLVDALMTGAHDDVEHRLLATLRQAAEESEAHNAGKDIPGSWAGSVHDVTAAEAFMARARLLLAEEHTGYAFTTHALLTVDGARRAASALSGEVAALLHEGDLEGVEQLGKGGIPAKRRDGTARDGTKRRVLPALGAVAVALAVALGVWWLIRHL